MSEPTSHICPECSTPRASDGTPSCACGRRASEALLETRTAEAAAAEDFDPLRIRPYVELGEERDGHDGRDGSAVAAGDGRGPDRTSTIAMPMTTAATTAATAATTTATTAPWPDPTDTRAFGRRGEGAGGAGFDVWGTSSTAGTSGAPGAAGTQGAAGAAGAPGTRGASHSAASTRALFPAPPSQPSTRASSPDAAAGHPVRRRRRRRAGIAVVLAGTAAAGVMAAAGFASGLFSYSAPERDRALPDDLRASAPDASPDGEASPAGPSGEGGGGAPAPAPGGGAGKATTPSPTRSPSPSPSASEASGSPSPSVSADPTQSGSPSAGASTGSSATGSDGSKDSRIVAPKTLRPGDDDPEVSELQLRLRQLGLYTGDIDENYDDQVEQAVLFYQSSRGITKDQDEPGVYGLVTRERLESETKQP
ncbi:Putative peptidoglycan binding domain-containing protein [Streptomyces sp. 1222.2]|uniref:peptidoglycan-binding domain-containing protein n=1 Tax=Streptomyces sp. 1222.2 TaxID=1938833 RepID=UPI000BCCACD3|nr:peptidoglycan-binding protein [Streptomyces sp. 1222.2]SOD77794.1 Putative peptidoglycan binding domain-containing protein [Streptomyces sp. 1222.2]